MLVQARFCARLVGLCVAAIAVVAATHFLSVGFETTPLITEDRLQSVTDWVRRPPKAGPGILAAVGAGLVGVTTLVGVLWPRRGPKAIATRRRAGWTRIDQSSLVAAIERHLEAVDRRNDVKATITRRGRVNVEITTTDLSVDGPGSELRTVLEELCTYRQLPCRPGTITVRPRTKAKRPQTVR